MDRLERLIILKSDLPQFDVARLQLVLAGNSLISRFYYYPEIDSTMSQARRLASGPQASHHHGTLLIADYQTGGKGRHGRAWLAPPGTSLLATLILARSRLPGPPDAAQLSLLSSAIPVAVCMGIADFLPSARIKYPNDIVAGGRKLGGILLEASGDIVLVGFGINCLQDIDSLPDKTRLPSSSLYLESGIAVTREELLQSILRNITEILEPENFAASVVSMNQLCETLGSTICIDTGDQVLMGIARNIASDGTLILETDTGNITLNSSMVIRTWFPDSPGDQT